MSDQVPQQFSDQKVDGSNLINVGTGITSINGDTTPAQIIAGSLNVSIVDVGPSHFIQLTPFLLNPGGVPVVVNPGVETVVLTANIAFAGLYQIFVNIGSTTGLPGTTLARCRIFNGPFVIGAQTCEFVTGATLDEIDFSVVSYTVHCAGGEVITAAVQQDSIGAITFAGVMNAIRLGE